MSYQKVNNLKVSKDLLSFINEELLIGSNLSPKKFWEGFDIAVHELSPKNKELINKRLELQKKIDIWNRVMFLDIYFFSRIFHNIQ